MENDSCLFCYEKESFRHLFFECCVAHALWEMVYEVTGKHMGDDFESVDNLQNLK
jgi:hypothetical protein